MKGLLFALMPDGLLSIILVFVGLALIFGLVSRQGVFNIIKMIILFALLSPFIYAIFDQLPSWLLILLIVGFAFSIARILLNALFGKGATDQFVGQVMFALFAMLFRIIGNLVRGRR